MSVDMIMGAILANTIHIGTVLRVGMEKKDKGKVQVVFQKKAQKADNSTEEGAKVWARVLSFMGGKEGQGVTFLPEKDDEVLVAFNGTNTSEAFVLGILHSDTRPGPEDANDKIKVIQTNKHKLVFDNENDKIEISNRDNESKISLFYDEGKEKEEISIESSGNINVKSTGGTLTIESSDKLTIKSGGEMNIEAEGDLNLKGSTINLNK